MKLFRAIFVLVASVVLAMGCKGNAGTDEKPVVLETPIGLAVHDSTTTSLTFQWRPVEGASGYKWALTKAGAAVGNGSVTTRNVQVSDLEAGTVYRFSVRAFDADGNQSEAAVCEAFTKKDGNGGNGGNGGGNGGSDLTARYAEFEIPEWEDDQVERAFPGAEGGGMYATGGRGGSVYHVTTLEDSRNQGSLRYALETLSGPRIVVFDVAGTIALQSKLTVKNGDVTIAGQSAPGDGICLKNYTFAIAASNVIVRFIRCRMGDEKKTEDDAMQVLSHKDDVYSDIIIDHCSVSWSTDECASFYGMKHFSLQWSFITESLRNSVHGKGKHGFGGIWGGTNASYHHNLLAHHDSRNPRIDHDYVSTQKGPVSIVNNVVYNWRLNTCYGGESYNASDNYRKYNFFNNYYKPGPNTSNKWLLDLTTSCEYCSAMSKYPDEVTDVPSGSKLVPGHVYMTGNCLEGKSSVTADNWTGTRNSVNASLRASAPFSFEEKPSKICLQSANDAFDAVLACAGASHVRDGIDTRIAGEVRNGTITYNGSNGSTGGLIDTQTDVQDDSWENKWPVYAYSENDEKLRDSDSDGMPNWFETEFGLDSSDPSDAKAVSIDKNGHYTNLEMYLHYIVKDIVKAQNTKGTYTYL